ncbi:BCCT family transporter [Nocardia tengchongensis]|uniref:BCCT family transporter n=1 Tax=Nocardia tengchongensis TaxID=2055889 RepID=A0ABX8CVG4_9NOCA|nr:BCCT family transporter [Nocardia tengchongensis]
MFWPSAIVVTAFTVYAIVFRDTAARQAKTLQDNVIGGFGWYYIVIVSLFVVFAIWLGLGRFGDITLGEDGEKAEYSIALGFPCCSRRAWGSAWCSGAWPNRCSTTTTPAPASGPPRRSARIRPWCRRSCTGASTRGPSTWWSGWPSRTRSTARAGRCRSGGRWNRLRATRSRAGAVMSSTWSRSSARCSAWPPRWAWACCRSRRGSIIKAGCTNRAKACR